MITLLRDNHGFPDGVYNLQSTETVRRLFLPELEESLDHQEN